MVEALEVSEVVDVSEVIVVVWRHDDGWWLVPLHLLSSSHKQNPSLKSEGATRGIKFLPFHTLRSSCTGEVAKKSLIWAQLM